jgi:hypothetical protein
MFAPKSENGRETEEVIGGWRKLYIQGVPRDSKGLIECTVCFLTLQSPVGHGLLILEVSR